MAFPLHPAWDSARNILCVRLDSLGDVLMTSPAIRALKESVPGRQITLLTSRSGAEAARLIPEIDGVIEYEAPWMKSTARRVNPQPDFDMVVRLQQGGFDAAAIFTVFSQNPLPAALLCYLAGIPLRLAYCRENPYQLLTDWVVDQTRVEAIPHEVRRQLDLVASLGVRPAEERLILCSPALSYSHVERLLAERGLDRSRPWVVMHTGSTAPSRRYDPQKYAETARSLVQEYGIQVVFSGEGSEADEIRKIQAWMEAPSISLAGQTGIGDLAALIDLAPLLISNNSGPVHLASGMGTPVVDLYALTNPQHTPWQVPNRVLNHDVPCKFCFHSICPEGHHHCLSLVTPAEVVRATLELLKETSNLSFA